MSDFAEKFEKAVFKAAQAYVDSGERFTDVQGIYANPKNVQEIENSFPEFWSSAENDPSAWEDDPGSFIGTLEGVPVYADPTLNDNQIVFEFC